MLNRVNSSLIYFQEICVNQFLCLHITTHNCVDCKQCSCCLSEQRVRRRSSNCVEVRIDRADWLRPKSRAEAVRLIPIYTVRKIVNAKARLNLF